MIAGYSSQLVSEEFLDRWLSTPGRLHTTEAFHRALRTWRVRCAPLGPASGLRALTDVAALPLVELLEWERLSACVVRNDCCIALFRTGTSLVQLLVTPWGASLHGFWQRAVVAGRDAGAAWSIVCNGTHMRLVQPLRLESRRYIEIDLDCAADDPRSAAALWWTFSGPALDATTASTSLNDLVVQAEQHASGVCRSLRLGVLDASTHVLRALLVKGRRHATTDVFEQSLTIVYRLLFLLFAEARGLVPIWHPIYRESYSVDALRQASLRPESVGVWDALRAMTRLAHAGCRAGGLKVTAFNGRLFSPARTPLAERHGLDDAAAKRAVVAVSTREAADGAGRERIDYRDLGVEQLGAVYETLLDYEPHVARDRRGAALHVSLKSGSGVRKATGTFYTPEALVTFLVKSTLSPLVREASPERILELAVLDPSMGSGAFLVGACHFLARAYESALIDTGRCRASDLGPADHAVIRRLVAERCLFGVDLNPTAVQLARLSLWLTTLAADRPLTILDHHLRVGDSLNGTWLSRLRTSPARVRAAEPLPLFPEQSMASTIQHVLPTRFGLARDPNDTAAQIHAKERALASLTAPGSPLHTWTRIADLWCAAWFASPPIPPGTFAPLCDQLTGGHGVLAPAMARELLERAERTRDSQHLFHWELEFPEVFFNQDGSRRVDAGFDAVLGNPPWDMVRADGHTDRGAARVQSSALVRFARDSGVYEARSDGQLNRYQLFTERSLALCKPGGRIGLVLPSGLVSDAGSAGLRRLLFSRSAVEQIVGFDNRSGTFPIHRSVKFVLVTATSGARTREIACRFGETNPAMLEGSMTEDGRLDASWFTSRIAIERLEHISGDDLSIPDLRSPIDLAIVERAAALFAPLGSPRGWHARFGRELNATEDRASLTEYGDGLPVFEGKHIEPFKADTALTRWRISSDAADRLLGRRHHHTRLAYRDVASATNRVTLIAALLPAQAASTHTLFCLKTALPVRSQQVLCALFNSLVLNYLVRMRVTTHVTTALVERLPVPTEEQLTHVADDLRNAAQRLARSHDADIFGRLNAQVAQLYQLREAEMVHVLSTFPLIGLAEKEATLRWFRSLEG
ncbi:MAG: N-6 DNA methylase [Vicinamibacterales bacterium]